MLRLLRWWTGVLDPVRGGRVARAVFAFTPCLAFAVNVQNAPGHPHEEQGGVDHTWTAKHRVGEDST